MNKNHVMYKLFCSFEQNGIQYLHFKSNTNLGKSFKGEADFDVLVDKKELLRVERLISENNGKRHNPVHIGNYTGVDNWLVFDDSDGKVYHLHLHYQLVTGKKFVKDYVIPWNNLLFESRIKDPEYDIFVTNPNVELMLLTFRIVLKSKSLDYLKKVFGTYRLDSAMQIEWDDIYKKSDYDEVKRFLSIVSPVQATEVAKLIYKPRLRSHDYLQLHRYVRKTMKLFRRYSGFEASIRTFLYQTTDYFRKSICKRVLKKQPITKKISLQGGLIVAFVGVDGAGKSTITNEIGKWMGKIESKRFYMGTGDGKTTLCASIIKRLIGFYHNNHRSKPRSQEHDHFKQKINKKVSIFTHPIAFSKSYARMSMICSVEKNNYKKIKKMLQYKLNGGICILDRWPQIEIPNQNDGPKLSSLIDLFGNKRFLRKRIEKELVYLGIVKDIKPDLIFRLNISLDTCMSRKSEHVNRSYFEHKIQELNQLSYQGARIVEVDAEKPYDEELLFIKRVLWKYV